MCFERIAEANCDALAIGAPIIAAFTHEKLFEQQAGKIETALNIYLENKYSFFS